LQQRGDYKAALERAQAARLLLILEAKGNLGLFLYTYWHIVLFSIIFLSSLGIVGFRTNQKTTISRKIEDINIEENKIGNLFIETQHQYFAGKISKKNIKMD